MRNLILLITLVVSMFSNAQLPTGLTVVENVVIDGTSYKFTQPNEVDTSGICFDNIDSVWLPEQILLNVETRSISYLNANYRVVASDYDAVAATIALYRGKGVTLYRDGTSIGSSLLECDGEWSDGNGDGWFTNSEFLGYAYNPVVSNDGATHTPQLLANFGGALNAGVQLGTDDRIYVGSFTTDALAVAAVEDAIRLHMNPLPESGTSTPTAAVGGWSEGAASGWFDGQSWRNSDYRGYHYRIISYGSDAIPSSLAGKFRVEVGFDENWATYDFYTTTTVIGLGSRSVVSEYTLFDDEPAAHDAARTFISSRSATSDDYTTTAAGSYRIIAGGFTVYYVEILTPNDVPAIFRAFTSFEQAEIFAADPGNYPAPTVSFSASDFVAGHANPGWLRGDAEGGIASYTVTAPTQFSNTVTATWVFTDNTGYGHSGSDSFNVPSTTRYYHGSTGVYYDDIAAIERAYPNNFQVRLDSGHFTLLHSYEQADIDRVQADAVAWAIDQINTANPVTPPSN